MDKYTTQGERDIIFFRTSRWLSIIFMSYECMYVQKNTKQTQTQWTNLTNEMELSRQTVWRPKVS